MIRNMFVFNANHFFWCLLYFTNFLVLSQFNVTVPKFGKVSQKARPGWTLMITIALTHAWRLITISCKNTSITTITCVDTKTNVSHITFRATCSATVAYFRLHVVSVNNSHKVFVISLWTPDFYTSPSPPSSCNIRSSTGGKWSGMNFCSTGCIVFISLSIYVMTNSTGTPVCL